MAALSNSSVLQNLSPLHVSPGYAFKSMDQYIGSSPSSCLSFRSIQIRAKQISTSRRALTVQARSRDSGRSGYSAIFFVGFLLGGIIFGALGCVYAPQISKALLGPERKELMKKMPKAKDDEEKALEKT